MKRLALSMLLPLVLAAAWPAHASPAAATKALDPTVAQCFEQRNRDPGAAIALADRTLAGQDKPVDVQIQLLACLVRAAALAGDVKRTQDTADRIDALLTQYPMPPGFSLRALSNAGAALHTVGRIQPALDFYVRAYEAAERDEAEIAQITTLVNVGSIYSEELGAFEQAESYFGLAAQIEATTGSRDPSLPFNRAMNYLRSGMHDQARMAFQEAQARASETGHDVVIQRSRAELLALAAGDDGTQATRQALDAVAAGQRGQDPAGAATTHLRVSQLALAAGDPATALAQALAAKELVAHGAFRTELRDALKAEIAARVALSQWREAFDRAESLRKLETQDLREYQLDNLAGLQARIQDTRSIQALERLQEERRLETLRLDNARRLRNGAIAAFFLLALLAGAFVVYQRGVNRKLERLSSIDSLTGLFNRRAGEMSLQAIAQGPAQDEQRSVVFLIDIDKFKDFNDQLGHAAGDRILAATAARLRAACRPGDVVSRWGGEEFLVICHDLDPKGAARVADRLLSEARAETPPAATSLQVTVSIGFACLPFQPGKAHPGSWQASVSLADRALYAAKNGGRDTWVGLWGVAGSTALPAAMQADPETHARSGDLQVLAASEPVQWSSTPG